MSERERDPRGLETKVPGSREKPADEPAHPAPEPEENPLLATPTMGLDMTWSLFPLSPRSKQ